MSTATTRRLILLRHAKAEHPERVEDDQRVLALAGRRQAAGIGAALTAADVAPDLVLCSSSVRTRQTWELARVGLDATPVVQFSDEVYEADGRSLLALVQGVSDDVRTLLVVGHEPTMSRVAELLAGPGSDEAAYLRVQVGVPTGSWSVLEEPATWAEWRESAAVLVGLHTPS